MNLMTMRFKGFTWRVNPTQLNLDCQRNVKEALLPFAESKTIDLGPKKRRVTGQGYFTGADCMAQWRELEAVFSQGGPGSLQLPGQEPFWAVMDALKLLGEPGKDLVKYSFGFTEYRAGETWKGQGVHRAAAGESLWDYAWRYDWDIEALRQANLHIRDIAYLQEGEEVHAP